MMLRVSTAVLLLIGLVSHAATAADDVFDSNGVKIRYVTEGEGEAVVLIHGWMSDSSMWGADKSGNTKLDAKMGKEFKIIAIDCRGHGKSDKPHDQAKYGPDMAADVVRLLDHLKIQKVHLVGYSMGSFVAGKVAATHPDRVLSIVYGGQAPIVEGLKVKADAVDVTEVFAKTVEEGRDLGEYILAVMPSDKKKPTPEQAKALAAFLYGGKDVKAFAAAGRSLGKLKVTEAELKKCQAPILFVHGSEDPVKEKVAAVRKLLDRGEVTVVKGADHMTTLTKPEFRNAIVDFLRANKQK
jgi:pimeloyl-ACP methyl ester carboxylesterase